LCLNSNWQALKGKKTEMEMLAVFLKGMFSLLALIFNPCFGAPGPSQTSQLQSYSEISTAVVSPV